MNESHTDQNAKVIWFTGLSGAGKTTLANELAKHLRTCSYSCLVLDGDQARSGLCSDLGFSEVDRSENIRRISEVAKLAVSNNIFVAVACISPRTKYRELAKSIVGKEFFIEIYVNTPLSVCEFRDPKGLYKKARTGEISEFTGISSPYEPPHSADLEIDTNDVNCEENIAKILKLLL